MGHPALQIVPGFPVIGLRNHTWTETLADRGIIISSFHYPSPQHPRYSRLVLHAALTPQDIHYITAVLTELCDRRY
jgi:selenocysteine lyase/cysteine desulfurase